MGNGEWIMDNFFSINQLNFNFMKKSKLEIGFLPEIFGVSALVISLYFVHNLFTATGVMVAMIFTLSVVQKGLNKMGVHVFSQNKHGHYLMIVNLIILRLKLK